MTNGNDPYFPSVSSTKDEGVLIRNEFAKAAMQGLISSCDWNTTALDKQLILATAAKSVELADALIEALNEGE